MSGDVDRGRVEPGYCDRCGHTFAEHAEAGICTFTCDCYQPGDFCGCDRSDLNEAGDVDRGRVAYLERIEAIRQLDRWVMLWEANKLHKEINEGRFDDAGCVPDCPPR